MARRILMQQQQQHRAPLVMLAASLLLLLLLAPTQAFTFSYFGSKGSGSTQQSSHHQHHRAGPALFAHRPLPGTDAFAKRTAGLVVPPSLHAAAANSDDKASSKGKGLYNPLFFLARFALSLAPSALMGAGLVPLLAEPRAVVAAQADDSFKIQKGAASTLNTGTVKTITRGVSIENANFEGKDLSGVSFQQSLIRDGNFRNSKLVSASFFDADLSGADFTGANMNQVNLELANMKSANLKNAIVTEAYVSGATRLTDIQIEGSDWSDTLLRKDQQQYLCKKASGVNPVTKISTKESLGCPE